MEVRWLLQQGTERQQQQPITRAKAKFSQTFPASSGHNITTRNKRPQSPARQVPENCEEDDDIPLTGKALRAIINQEIRGKLSSIISEIKNLTDLVDSFQRAVSFLSDRYDELKFSLDKKTEKIATLEKTNIILQESLQNLTKRVYNTENHARANNVEVQCIPEKKTENIIDPGLSIGKVLKSKIKDADISQCTRIAKKD